MVPDVCPDVERDVMRSAVLDQERNDLRLVLTAREGQVGGHERPVPDHAGQRARQDGERLRRVVVDGSPIGPGRKAAPRRRARTRREHEMRDAARPSHTRCHQASYPLPPPPKGRTNGWRGRVREHGRNGTLESTVSARSIPVGTSGAIDLIRAQTLGSGDRARRRLLLSACGYPRRVTRGSFTVERSIVPRSLLSSAALGIPSPRLSSR